MAQEANFTYLIDLVNPYLPDAEDTSKEETVRLIIKQASNNQYSPMPASSTLNIYAADGISRTAAKKLFKFINKETSSLEEYFSKIGADQLTLIANKLKEDGISSDVYRGKVPSLLDKLFTEEYERVASRKNNRQQKIPIQSADEDIFTKTVSDEMFAAVFRYVNVSEMDAVKNSNAIHAFVLKPELLPFNYEKLIQLYEDNLEENINFSSDQSEKLKQEISDAGIQEYPDIYKDKKLNVSDTKDFLLRLSNIFNWPLYERQFIAANQSPEIQDKVIDDYTKMTLLWISGFSLKQICDIAISIRRGGDYRFLDRLDRHRSDINNIN